MKKAPKCECLGHQFPINPDDCICSPCDAQDLATCHQDDRRKKLTLKDILEMEKRGK
jgi:hypothetical protein